VSKNESGYILGAAALTAPYSVTTFPRDPRMFMFARFLSFATEYNSGWQGKRWHPRQPPQTSPAMAIDQPPNSQQSATHTHLPPRRLIRLTCSNSPNKTCIKLPVLGPHPSILLRIPFPSWQVVFLDSDPMLVRKRLFRIQATSENSQLSGKEFQFVVAG